MRLEEAMLRTLFRYLMSSKWLHRREYGTCVSDFDIMVKYPVEGQVSNVSMKNVMSWVGGTTVTLAPRVLGRRATRRNLSGSTLY